MTSRRIFSTLVVSTLAAATRRGCGNYSNEDLEFMNAVPAREDISAQHAARGR